MLRNFGTVGLIYLKIAPKVAQDFKEKSHKSSRCGEKTFHKIIAQNIEGGAAPPPPPPALLGLKPMYRFGKWWKLKFSLMGFVYRVVWGLKALWIILSETIDFLRKLHKTLLGCPRKFYHRVMYIAPSSGHISLYVNMPFTLILRRFEVVFWCLEWEAALFERLMEIHSNPPMLYYGFNWKQHKGM